MTIQAELQGCSNNIGYRQMWVVLKQKHGLVVKRYCEGLNTKRLSLVMHATTLHVGAQCKCYCHCSTPREPEGVEVVD